MSAPFCRCAHSGSSHWTSSGVSSISASVQLFLHNLWGHCHAVCSRTPQSAAPTPAGVPAVHISASACFCCAYLSLYVSKCTVWLLLRHVRLHCCCCSCEPCNALPQVASLSGGRRLTVRFRPSKRALGKLTEGHPDARDSPAVPHIRCDLQCPQLPPPASPPPPQMLSVKFLNGGNKRRLTV